MNGGFSRIIGPGGVSAIAFNQPGEKFEHGFVGKGVLDKPHSPEEARAVLTALFPGAAVIVPRQTHGNQVIDGTDSSAIADCEGDALTLPLPSAKAIALCIRTADCLPILITSETTVAVVHAGWRGLANGIIQNALRRFAQGTRIRAIIGPCAGPSCYPVGPEVFEAIGDLAVKSCQGAGLDLAGTAGNILRSGAPEIEVFDSGICTICDPTFHSYRRDGGESGRNFTYLVIRPDSA